MIHARRAISGTAAEIDTYLDLSTGKVYFGNLHAPCEGEDVELEMSNEVPDREGTGDVMREVALAVSTALSVVDEDGDRVVAIDVMPHPRGSERPGEHHLNFVVRSTVSGTS
ncbi:MAG: hypothetical protein JW839_06040 [Candidatus Lokiarchaeota archaeon]|nr:hypothetical protein [Candidatus Lokiarchaeota archaeon]